MRRVITTIVLAAAIGGCGITQGGDGGSKLTEAQRDSVLGKSGLAGTSAIGHAMSSADAQSKKAATLDAQIDSLPR